MDRPVVGCLAYVEQPNTAQILTVWTRGTNIGQYLPARRWLFGICWTTKHCTNIDRLNVGNKHRTIFTGQTLVVWHMLNNQTLQKYWPFDHYLSSSSLQGFQGGTGFQCGMQHIWEQLPMSKITNNARYIHHKLSTASPEHSFWQLPQKNDKLNVEGYCRIILGRRQVRGIGKSVAGITNGSNGVLG